MSKLSRDAQLVVCLCCILATILLAPTIYIFVIDDHFRIIGIVILCGLTWSLVLLFAIAEILLELSIPFSPVPPDGGRRVPMPALGWPLPEGKRPFSFFDPTLFSCTIASTYAPIRTFHQNPQGSAERRGRQECRIIDSWRLHPQGDGRRVYALAARPSHFQ